LLVDDDSELAKIVGMLMRRRGDTLVWAADLEEAEQYLEAFADGVMLLDVNLPGQSGIEWLRQRRSRPSVAMFVQRQLVEDLTAAWNAGADFFLYKECITHPTLWNSRLDEICQLHHRQFPVEFINSPMGKSLAEWLNPALEQVLGKHDADLVDALLNRCIRWTKERNPTQESLGVQYGKMLPCSDVATIFWGQQVIHETGCMFGRCEAERLRVALDRS
jgi:CheY-like chemotaxis protein